MIIIIYIHGSNAPAAKTDKQGQKEIKMVNQKQADLFFKNQDLREEIFNKVRWEINGYHEYLTIVDSYDHNHGGNIDALLEAENKHLVSVLEKLNK